MKKISILLFLPLFVFAQPSAHFENDLAYVDYKVEINVQLEREVEDEHNKKNLKVQRDAVFINFQVPSNFTLEIFTPMKTLNKNVPKHLNTLSLSGQTKVKHQPFAAQKRLDNLLTMNDIEFPKENTLLKRLNPVRYKSNGFSGAENMPEGFGPKIKF